MKTAQSKFGGAKIAILLAVVAILGGGFAAYKLLFNRPGESAIGLIPADAGSVITLDTNPSANQMHAYQTISDSLKKEGVDEKVADGISELLGKAGIAQELRQYVKTSFAAAFWPPEGSGKPRGVALISISDPGAVNKVLAKIGSASNGIYKCREMYLAVVDSYLAIGMDADVIARVQAVKNGAPSIASLQEYQLARQDLPADANFMVFVAPKGLQFMAKSMGGNKMAESANWAAFSATLRDDGLQFDARAPVNASTMPSMAKLSAAKPLDASTFSHLPAGAYGILALSSPANYYDMMDEAMRSNRMGAQQDEAIKEFEKQTGLSLRNDILPALRGNTVMAWYPDAGGEKKSFDFVLLADNSNGADPVALSEKINPVVEKMSKGKAHFVKTEENGATIYALDASSQEKMLEGMSAPRRPQMTMPSSAPDFGSPAMPPGNWRNMPPDGQFHSVPAPSYSPEPKGAGGPTPTFEDLRPGTGPSISYKPATDDTPRQIPTELKDKTITWAEVNGCVVIASSKPMLEKALAAFHGGQTLATDPAFSPTIARLSGDQQAMILSMRRIMEGMRPWLEESMGHGGPSFDDIENLFGPGDAAMFMGGKVQNNVGSGTWFLPLDFDRIAAMIHKVTAPQPMPSPDITMPK